LLIVVFNIKNVIINNLTKEDIENDDIPILYSKEKTIYYGSARKFIGTRKEEGI
jgi:hypothetical protein